MPSTGKIGKVPFVAYGNDGLAAMPRAKVGKSFKFPKCGKRHKLEPADDGSTTLMFYRCSGKSYLGAVDGRLVVK